MQPGQQTRYEQLRFDQEDARLAQIERDAQRSAPMSIEEHRAHFRQQLAEGNHHWQQDFMNAVEDDEQTGALFRRSLKLLACGNHVDSVLHMNLAMNRAADWFYEGNEGRPF